MGRSERLTLMADTSRRNLPIAPRLGVGRFVHASVAAQRASHMDLADFKSVLPRVEVAVIFVFS